MFREAARRFAKADALASFRDGAWRPISHAEMVARVRRLSAGLHTLGLGRGDRVAILCESRPEWTLVDLATLGIGAALVPIYPTVTAEQAAFILRDSGARLLVISGEALFDRIAPELGTLPALERLVTVDAFDAPTTAAVSTLAELENMGAEVERLDPGLAECLAEDADEDDLATLIYTSGTTGTPKGVILTHKNILSNIRGIRQAYDIFGPSDVALSFLPLSHVFERTAVYAYLHFGVSVYFARSIETVVADLAAARPTVMTSVPRLYEKAYARVKEVAVGNGPKARLVDRLLVAGTEWARARHAGVRPRLAVKVGHALADLLIYRRWRQAFGGRIRFLLSGGAPLAPEIAYAFLAAGLPIYEGYGLTETSPVISFNRPGAYRIGTVGRPLANVAVVVDMDGELLVRGPSVTRGYYHLPDATADSLTADGYFRTGDIGYFDDDGYLVITDRKKDLLKTSGGKYVAPQPIETTLKVSNLFTQAIVIGDRRNYVTALLVPNAEALRAALARRGFEADADTLDANPRVAELCLELVDEMTPHLARYEKIKKVALLPRELTVEAGELTPTLKIKRRVVEQRYRSVIDRLYNEPAPAQSVSNRRC
jgi:long-chain acyl-CoA synthetase